MLLSHWLKTLKTRRQKRTSARSQRRPAWKASPVNRSYVEALEDRTLLTAPVLTDLDATVTFLENTVNLTPQIIDSDVSVTDSTNFDGGNLTVTNASGLLEDQLSIQDVGTGLGEIGFDGADVTFEGTVIGTVSAPMNGINGASLVVTFNADATLNAVETLIENLTYQNNSDTPTANRTISITIENANAEISVAQMIQINVTPEGDPLVITGVQDGTPDTFLVTSDGINIIVSVNGGPSTSTPVAEISTLTLSGTNDNDTFIIDFANILAFPAEGIIVTGNGPTSAPGDSLVIVNGDFANGVYDVRSGGSGTLTLDDSVIVFSGLEPIDMTGSTIDVLEINIDEQNQISDPVTTTIAQDSMASTDTLISFDTMELEPILLRSITGTLIINGDSNDVDIINVEGVGDGFEASLDINGNPDDSVNLNGGITFAADKSLTVDAKTITAPNMNSDYATSGDGLIELTAVQNITLGSGSSFTTINGGITFSANAAETQVADFIGIDANNATIESTGTGNIEIRGRGSEDGNNTSGMYGVYLHAGTIVSSTVTGMITIDGIGGSGTSDNHGVFLTGSTTSVSSTAGNLSITGQGGNGSGNDNRGVQIASDATVHVTSGLLTVTGIAGAGDSQGVLLDNTTGGRLLSLGSGGISITATGSGSGPDLEVGPTSRIGFDGTNATTGDLTINADTITLSSSANMESDGALVIAPRTPTTPIGLGNGSGVLQLDTNELSVLKDGFSSITIGSPTGTGAVDVSSATFVDPMTIRGGAITVSGGLTAEDLVDNGDGTSAVNLTLIAQSPVSINADMTATGNINITATDSANPGDDVSLGSGVTVQSTGGNILIDAGDDFTMAAGSTLNANGLFAIQIDAGNADAGTGATANLGGTLVCTGASTINGAGDSDTFHVNPISTANLTINGGAPTAPANPGDTLNYNGPGLLAFTSGDSGTISQASFNNVAFTGMETVNTQFVSGTNGDFTVSAGPEAGDGIDDVFVVQRQNGNIEVSVGPDAMSAVLVFSQPAGDVTSLTIEGSSDDDTLIVDYSNGVPIPSDGLIFHGNGDGINDNDVLRIIDTTSTAVTSVAHTFSSSSNGSVRIQSTTGVFQAITYTGLEPITDTLVAGTRTFTFGAASDQITLADADPTDADPDLEELNRISSAGTSETVDFASPTNQLTINAGSGDDTITLEDLDPTFNANVTVFGDQGRDTFDLEQTRGDTNNTYTLNGNGGADVFNIQPTDEARPNITINGDDPGIPSGDVLNYDGIADVTPTSIGEGTVISAGNQPVSFTGIELVNTQNPPQLMIDDMTVNESVVNGLVTLTVTLTRGVVQPVTVDVTTANSSATADSDYIGLTQTLTFLPGMLTQTVDIPIINDVTVEGNEVFFVNLSNASGATIGDGVGRVTITDNDSAVLSINSISRAENGVFDFTVTLSNPVAHPVTVQIDTTPTMSMTNTNATPGIDFTAIAGQIVPFSPGGPLTQTATVQVADDAIMENDETFEVRLSNALVTGAMVPVMIDPNNNVGVGTILNNDIASLSINDVTRREDETFLFTITLSNPISEDITFDVATAETTNPNDNATSDVDFVALTQQQSFTAGGALTTTIEVTVTKDDLVENAETFNVVLSNAIFGAGNANGPIPIFGDAIGLGTILNDDIDLDILPLPPAEVARNEGNAGDTAFTFTVLRTGDLSGSTTVEYMVTGMGGLNGADFGGNLPTGIVSFDPGQSAETLTILVSGDQTVELNEAFTVTLMNPSANAQINNATAMGTILNDDTATLTISDVSLAEGDMGSTPFQFTATLSQPLPYDVTANFQVTGSGINPATANDFVGNAFPMGTFTIAAGQISTLISLDGLTADDPINVSGDLMVEPNETFRIVMNNADINQATVLAGPAATGTILNDDYRVAIGPVTIDRLEGNAGDNSYVYTLTRTGDLSGLATLDFEVTGSGTHAANAEDFGGTFPMGQVTFNPGEAKTTLVIRVQGDQTVEFEEGFTVTIDDPTEKAQITTASATGTIRNDDTAVISINSVSGSESDGMLTFEVTSSNPFAEEIVLKLNKATVTAGINDFDTAQQMLTLTPGMQTFQVPVTVMNDQFVEADETFRVSLQVDQFGGAQADSRVMASPLQGVGTGTIRNDDSATVSIFDDVSATESAGVMDFIVSLTSGTLEGADTISVFVETVLGSGTATAGVDYTAISQPLVFSLDAADPNLDGDNNPFTRVVRVNLEDMDQLVELDETFDLRISDPRYNNTPDPARVIIDPMGAVRTGTIIDEDVAFIRISDATGREGDPPSGNSPLQFNVTLVGQVAAPVTVQAQTQDGTATANQPNPDYQAFNQILPAFDANGDPMQERIVEIPVNADGIQEGVEDFLVKLSEITYGGMTGFSRIIFQTDPTDPSDTTPGEAVGQILDLTQVQVEFTSNSLDVAGNEDGGPLNFQLKLSGEVQDTVTVFVRTMATPDSMDFDADPTNNADFTPLNSFPVVFQPGQLVSDPISVVLTGDAANPVVEPEERFRIEIESVVVAGMPQPSRVDLGTNTTATGRILNDDFANLTISNPRMAEGNPGANNLLTFTIELDAAVQGGLTFNYATQPTGSARDAMPNQDFLSQSGMRSFGSSPGMQFVSVPIVGDSLTERDETLLLTLSGLTADNLSALTLQTSATGTITNDDSIFVTGAGVGGGSHVVVTNQFNQQRFSFMAFDEPNYSGGVRVATGDVNGDGVPDIITAPGPGREATVRVFDGVTNAIIANFAAYPGFTAGMFVTAADVVGNDGIVEIITSPDAGGGPHIKVFTGVNQNGSNPTVLTEFMVYDTAFMGGVRIATGDVTGDGTPDLITGPGVGGGPHIRVFDLTQPQGLIATDISATSGTIGSFMAFSPSYTGGVFVAAGDFGGNSPNQADIVVSQGMGSSRVRIIDAADLSFMQINPFPGFQGGVRVATVERFGNATPDLVVGAGPSGGPQVRIFDGGAAIDVNDRNSSDLVTLTETELDPNPAPAASFIDFAYSPNFMGGVFVAGTVFPPTAGSPLRLAEDVRLPAVPVNALSQADLDSTVVAAVKRWEQAGLDSTLVARLAGTPIVIGNLAPGLLGLATDAGIFIDDDAAGAGWFIDRTPLMDEEFQSLTSRGLAATNPLAVGGVDLLTVVLHELGHALGWEDLAGEQHAAHLMAETLAPNLRRLPEGDSLDELFASGHLLDELLMTHS